MTKNSPMCSCHCFGTCQILPNCFAMSNILATMLSPSYLKVVIKVMRMTSLNILINYSSDKNKYKEREELKEDNSCQDQDCFCKDSRSCWRIKIWQEVSLRATSSLLFTHELLLRSMAVSCNSKYSADNIMDKLWDGICHQYQMHASQTKRFMTQMMTSPPLFQIKMKSSFVNSGNGDFSHGIVSKNKPLSDNIRGDKFMDL